jgi:hypothetical protein
VIIHGEAVPRFARAANQGLTVMVLGVACKVIFKRASTLTNDDGTTAQVAHVDLIPQAWPYQTE